MNFSLHNLLYFTIDGVNKRYLDYLGREYSFFRTEETIDPDLEIVIADSVHPEEGCQLVANKYLVKEGYLYCQDRYKVAGWRLAINGLEGKTVVHFSGGFWGEHVLKEFIIEPLFGFKLALKGASILHASAMAIGGAGFIFAGGAGVGKTASILSLNAGDNIFLADELTVLSVEGKVYSFPTPIRIYFYDLAGMLPGEMTLRHKLGVKIRHYGYLLSLGYAKLPLCLNAEELFSRIGGVYPLRCLFLLTKSNGEDIKVTEITDKKELVERLVHINEQQFPYWCQYALAYSSVYRSGRPASYLPVAKANLAQALDGVACYEIKTPSRFSRDHRDKFRDLVQSLGGVG